MHYSDFKDCFRAKGAKGQLLILATFLHVHNVVANIAEYKSSVVIALGLTLMYARW